MGFLEPVEVEQTYQANLQTARSALLPEGAGFPMSDAVRAKLRRAHNSAVNRTKRQVGERAWREYRRWQTELGPPVFENGEMVRESRSGARRVDRRD